jgi:hypothetical protein
VILDASRFVLVAATSTVTAQISTGGACGDFRSSNHTTVDGKASAGDNEETEEKVAAYCAPELLVSCKDGVSTVAEVMGYFVSIVVKCASDDSAVKGSSNATASQGRQNQHHRRAVSLSSSSLTSMSLGDTSYNALAQELLLAMKAVHHMLLGEGDLDKSRLLIAR